MRPSDYYLKTDNRSCAWAERAAEEGFAPVASVIEASLPFIPGGKRVLDIGCQGGHQLALLRDRFGEAHGLDIAPYTEMWSYFPDINFLVHDVDAERIPFPDAHFDTIVATNVLEHVFDVFGLVSEISRLLIKGGTCLLSEPNVAEIRRVASVVRGRVPVTGGDQYPFTPDEGWDGQHLHYFTPSAVSGLLASHNLKISETLIIGRFPKIKRVWLSGLSSSIDVVAIRV